jgi:hypothetical protein
VADRFSRRFAKVTYSLRELFAEFPPAALDRSIGHAEQLGQVAETFALP